MDTGDCEGSRVLGELADRRVRREDQPATVRLEPVLVDEPAQQGIVRVAPLEPGRADDLIFAVDGLRDPEPSFRGCPIERIVPGALRADTTGAEISAST